MVGIEHLFLDNGRPASRGKRIFRAVVVLGLCGVLLAIAWSEYREAAVLASWPSRPCRIVRSTVESVGTGLSRQYPYHPRISFAYEAFGRIRSASTYQLSDYGTDDAAEAYAITRGYPAGSTSVCYVDPADGNRAVLSRPSVSASNWFLGAVVAGTATALWFYCIPQLRGGSKPPRRNTGRGKLVFAVVSGIAMFCLFGGLFVTSYAVPLARQMGTPSWQTVPCTVVESNVLWNELGGEIHLVTYRTDIHYRYDWNGTEYHSNQFNLTEGSTLFSCLRLQAIRQFSPGTRSTCFVDPRHPNEAVLVRRLSPGVMMGTFFLAFGLLMLWIAILLMRSGENQANAAFLRHWRALVGVGALAGLCVVMAQILPP